MLSCPGRREPLPFDRLKDRVALPSRWKSSQHSPIAMGLGDLRSHLSPLLKLHRPFWAVSQIGAAVGLFYITHAQLRSAAVVALMRVITDRSPIIHARLPRLSRKEMEPQCPDSLRAPHHAFTFASLRCTRGVRRGIGCSAWGLGKIPVSAEIVGAYALRRRFASAFSSQARLLTICSPSLSTWRASLSHWSARASRRALKSPSTFLGVRAGRV